MDWILYAAVICGITGVGYGLNTCGLDLQRICAAGCFTSSVRAILKDALKLVVKKKKKWVALGFLLALVLLIHVRRPWFSLFFAGFLVSWALGLVCVTISLATKRQPEQDPFHSTSYKSRLAAGILIMGYELSCLACCMLIAKLTNLTYCQFQSAFLGMGFGFCAAAPLFYRSGPDRGESNAPGSDVQSEPPSDQHGRRHLTQAYGEPDAAVSASVLRGYAGIMVAATLLGNIIYGTKAAALTPLLIGTASLAACMGAGILWETMHDPLKTKWGAAGVFSAGAILACAFAEAALYYVGDLIQVGRQEIIVPPMPWIDLFGDVVGGIVLTGIVAFVTPYFSWKSLPGDYVPETEPSKNLLNDLARLAKSCLVTIFPFAMTGAAIAAGYLLGEGVGGKPNTWSLGIAITSVSIISISGIATATESREILTALRRLYDGMGMIVCVLVVNHSFLNAVERTSHEQITFDLSSPATLAGLLIGGLIPYIALALILVIAFKGGRSLIHEVVVRAGRMR